MILLITVDNTVSTDDKHLAGVHEWVSVEIGREGDTTASYLSMKVSYSRTPRPLYFRNSRGSNYLFQMSMVSLELPRIQGRLAWSAPGHLSPSVSQPTDFNVYRSLGFPNVNQLLCPGELFG